MVDELHRRQGDFYAGGPEQPLAELLSESVRWHVPGASPIAGDHAGREATLAYMRRRRELARATMRMLPRGRLVVGDVVVERVDGIAALGGQEVEWRTVGIYRVEGGRVAEAWLVPLEPERFDELWSRG